MCLVYVLTPDEQAIDALCPGHRPSPTQRGKSQSGTTHTLYHQAAYTSRTTSTPNRSHLGVDTGSAVVGSAVADEEGTIFYLSEVEMRNDIAATMKERASKRRNRRNAKRDIAQPAG